MATSTETAPESSIGGILWPAFPAAGELRTFAILFQLEQTQWWTTEELRAHQLRQASALVSFAAANVPFYRERLAGLADGAAQPMSASAWARIPILTRAEAQEAGGALNPAQSPPGHGPLLKIVTSGATGRPVTVVSTALAIQFRKAARLRADGWYRRDYAAKTAFIRRLGADRVWLVELGHGKSWAAGYATGPRAYRDVDGSVEDHLAWLAAEDPEYLSTYPTMAHTLATRAMESKLKLPRLKEICTTGERLDPAVREACRRAWNVPVTDSYGAREIGAIAVQCPDHPQHYHVQSEDVLVEVVDDDGYPCRPGAIGRVVATPLHNFATPLVRYHLGDYAEVGEQCPCGRGLPVLRKIMGRVRAMATLPGGRRVFPALDGAALAQVAPLRQIQLVQRRTDEIDVNLVASRELSASELVKLRAAIERAFGHAFALRLRYVAEIPRSPSGTFEDFRCEIAVAPRAPSGRPDSQPRSL